MRKLFALCALLAVGGCQQKIAVPTSRELIENPQLLAEWKAKCDTGEYSHLPADQKAGMCAATVDATTSVAQMNAGNEEADFFENNTIRKR